MLLHPRDDLGISRVVEIGPWLRPRTKRRRGDRRERLFATLGEGGEALGGAVMGADRVLPRLGAEGGADQAGGEAGLGHDQGFGEPEDEIGEAERILLALR